MKNRLYDKVYGCIAASQVGSAMGGPVENMTYEEIKAEYGKVEKMLPYPEGDSLKHNSGFPPGSTEDGIERQKLIALAIIDKGGPITARDLAASWIKYVNEESFGKMAGAQDEIHYRLLKAGISPEESGYFDAHIGRMGFNRACHPIGVINACFPELAAFNALDVARIYQPPSGRGLPWKEDYRKIIPAYSIGIDWGAAVASAIAEAFKPEATVDSIVEASTSYIVEAARDEILYAVELASNCSDFEELVYRFNKRYNATGMPMAQSRAYEVTSKGIALFHYYKGDVKETILASVNFGRDTDCLAAVSAGIAGAFNGSQGIPQEWIKTVDSATKQNQYTITQMTIEEMSTGLYETLLKHYRKVKTSVLDIDTLKNEKKV